MSGSDGVTLDGMYHEEHALPGVRPRPQPRPAPPAVDRPQGRDAGHLLLHGRPQKVRVEVRFPRGVWTQWYPQAAGRRPAARCSAGRRRPAATAGSSGAPSRPGRRDRPGACRRPRPTRSGISPATSTPRSSGRRAGTSGTGPAESERFLFYRGLGRGPAAAPVSPPTAGGTLDRRRRRGRRRRATSSSSASRAARASTPTGPRCARASASTGRHPRRWRAPGRSPSSPTHRRRPGGAAGRERPLSRRRRARWSTPGGPATSGPTASAPCSSCRRPGPTPSSRCRSRPTPQRVVRVMVGRIELLTPERERLAEAAVRDLASPDAASRGAAFEFLREPGPLRRADRPPRAEDDRATSRCGPSAAGCCSPTS